MPTCGEKALQYPDTRRTAFLEGFPTTVDCRDWSNWFNHQLTRYLHKTENVREVDGKPLVCAIRMAFVKTDKPYIPGQKNTNPRAPHVDFLDS